MWYDISHCSLAYTFHFCMIWNIMLYPRLWCLGNSVMGTNPGYHHSRLWHEEQFCYLTFIPQKSINIFKCNFLFPMIIQATTAVWYVICYSISFMWLIVIYKAIIEWFRWLICFPQKGHPRSLLHDTINWGQRYKMCEARMTLII